MTFTNVIFALYKTIQIKYDFLSMILVLRNYELFENVLSSEEGKELALLSSD